MWKTEKWHWNRKQKKTFSILKKNLNETAHFVILQAACEKVLEINALNFAVDACLY